jgi:glycosyltransferase involved in cell wall biosynthesis
MDKIVGDTSDKKILITRSKTPVIMHLNASNFYGGPEKQIIEHTKRIDPARYKVIVAAFLEGSNESEILQRARDEKLMYDGIPMSGPFDIRALFLLINLLRSRNVDLLCTHGYKSTVLGWCAARRTGISVAAFSRGYTAENKKIALYEKLDRMLLRKVDAIISVSAGQKKKLVAYGIKREPHWVVHNSISLMAQKSVDDGNYLPSFVKENQVAEHSTIVVSAGRLSPEKGHRYLVRAIAKLKDNNAVFIFCGDGPCMESLKAEARALDVFKRCRFIGFRRDIQKIFSIMDFMVLPSLTEGLPNVVLESFSEKKTVIATNVGGVPEVVFNEENGLLVPAKSVDSLAKAIDRLCSDPALQTKLGENGYRTVLRHFSFEDQAVKLEEIYRNLLLENQ